jgi:SOS-response transcriptional repressor LexA
MSETVRPTKKQRDILVYIERFIGEHGYSPSYREIMNGLDYTSVATVSLHVNSLIQRGHLRKRDRSARSLEVVEPTGKQHSVANNAGAAVVEPAQEKWLIDTVDNMFRRIESTEQIVETAFDELSVLLSALRVLGLQAAASSFMPRLSELRVRVITSNPDEQGGV